MEAIASRAGSNVFSSAPRNSDTPPAKRSKGLSSNEVCKEKTTEALDLLVQQRHVLKKSKLPLCQLILREYPDHLKEVALLLSALPPTQVSVERLFSSLKSDLRNRLGEKLLSSMLFLRTNM